MTLQRFILVPWTLVVVSGVALGYDEYCSFQGRPKKHFAFEESDGRKLVFRYEMGPNGNNDDNHYVSGIEKKPFRENGALRCYGDQAESTTLEKELGVRDGRFHGEFREYGAVFGGSKRVPRQETTFNDGREEGLRLEYGDGRVTSRAVVQGGELLSSATYHSEGGILSALHCTKAARFDNEVDKMCGFNNKLSKVRLADGRHQEVETRYYVNGKVVLTDLESEGGLSARVITVPGRKSELCPCQGESGDCSETRAAYNKRGKLESLSCGCIQASPDALSAPEYTQLHKLCGYQGLSHVEMYESGDSKKLVFSGSYLKGLLHGAVTNYNAQSGKPRAQFQFDRGVAVGEAREYFNSGELNVIRKYAPRKIPDPKRIYGQSYTTLEDGEEVHFDADKKKLVEFRMEHGRKVLERNFFLNGNIKQETVNVLTPNGKSGTWVTQNRQYRDDGKPIFEESLIGTVREGTSRWFHENGAVALVGQYKQGQLQSVKYFSPSGESICSEEFEKDGSRKSVGLSGGKRTPCPPESWTSKSNVPKRKKI